MIDYLTVGISTTGAGTRILTLLLLTGTIRRTIGVKNTLGTTTVVGIAKVFRQTLTRSNTVPFATNSIGPTWTRAAGCTHFDISFDFWTALNEWITGKALLADALHHMADDAAVSVGATASWAWINTLLVNTSQLTATVRAGDTLRSTIWWPPYISFETGTGGRFSNRTTLRVGATGRWSAWIYWLNITNWFNWG